MVSLGSLHSDQTELPKSDLHNLTRAREAMDVPRQHEKSAAREPDEKIVVQEPDDAQKPGEKIAAPEPGHGGYDDQLKAHLRSISDRQKLSISGRMLDEGMRSLKEDRFTYSPVGGRIARGLAAIWLERRTTYGWIGLGLMFFVAFALFTRWDASQFAFTEEARQIELTQTLPWKLKQQTEAALAEAKTTDAKEYVQGLNNEGAIALAGKDVPKVHKIITELETVRAHLARTYVLRIVARPNEQSGVFRIPKANANARNYYLIVEAVMPDGKILSMRITNEENNSTTTVTKWGVRVPQATFDAVRKDKGNGVALKKDILGRKPQGALTEVYDMPVMDGAITEW